MKKLILITAILVSASGVAETIGVVCVDDETRRSIKLKVNVELETVERLASNPVRWVDYGPGRKGHTEGRVVVVQPNHILWGEEDSLQCLVRDTLKYADGYGCRSGRFTHTCKIWTEFDMDLLFDGEKATEERRLKNRKL